MPFFVFIWKESALQINEDGSGAEMREYRYKIKGRVSLMALTLCICANVLISYAAEDESNVNRFNVAIVLDASNSMNYTDPDGFRYEAISQFTDLLAERGNYLSGIVFSNHVEAFQEPEPVSKQEDKEKVTDLLASVMSAGVTEEMGYTNIGEALSKAVDMLVSEGNGDLPSVIVFLSDGNTEMPTDSEQNISLEEKASAIQKARENHVSIYTVCLNANNKADISEMEQISKATGGEFQEVGKADDLVEVTGIFYNMIYGTSRISLGGETFPDNGLITKGFEVPGFGVEEVNILINGRVTDTSLIQPDGKEYEAKKNTSGTYTRLKITEIQSGDWMLKAEGDPGSSVDIDMVYNSNLNVEAEIEPDGKTFTSGQSVDVKAILKAGEISAEKDSQYAGYHATLHLMDAYGRELETKPMSVSQGRFEAKQQFDVGDYYLKVTVEGNSLNRDSEDIGPFHVKETSEADNDDIENTPPEAVETPIRKTVYVWPFKGGSLSFNMAELAKDAQDDELAYEIVSSSFIEGEDYHLDGDTVTLDHFSLSKGSFDIKAMDSRGLFCNIELIVTARNVGVMALIGIGILAAAVMIALAFIMRRILTRPFGGAITVCSDVNGQTTKRDEKINPGRGRCRLSSFNVDHIGGDINYSKSYFQAADQKQGKYVEFRTNVPVYYQGRMTDNIKVKSGSINEAKISSKADSKDFLYIKFESRVTGSRQRIVRKNTGKVNLPVRQRTNKSGR